MSQGCLLNKGFRFVKSRVSVSLADRKEHCSLWQLHSKAVTQMKKGIANHIQQYCEASLKYLVTLMKDYNAGSSAKGQSLNYAIYWFGHS